LEEPKNEKLFLDFLQKINGSNYLNKLLLDLFKILKIKQKKYYEIFKKIQKYKYIKKIFLNNYKKLNF